MLFECAYVRVLSLNVHMRKCASAHLRMCIFLLVFNMFTKTYTQMHANTHRAYSHSKERTCVRT